MARGVAVSIGAERCLLGAERWAACDAMPLCKRTMARNADVQAPTRKPSCTITVSTPAVVSSIDHFSLSSGSAAVAPNHGLKQQTILRHISPKAPHRPSGSA